MPVKNKPETEKAGKAESKVPAANLKWVGVRLPQPETERVYANELDRPEVEPEFSTSPPGSVHIGMLDIELPSPAEQRAGFYSEHASAITGCVPGYKLLV